MQIPPSESRTRNNHIVIAGTGRAGTTFLVHYLTELGLETHISRHGLGSIDANANAGLEDPTLLATELPYVIKAAPWIGEYVDDLLASPDIQIDAVVIPVRDLVEAASSRAILELRALHQGAPWMAQQFSRTWENWGVTPGGAIFSLNPVDQARILAVSFHRLIQRLVDAGIPIVFLGFPRLVEDGDYLFERLKPILPGAITREQALAAHQQIAQHQKVRVGDELGSDAMPGEAPSVVPTGLNYPDHDKLDRIALGREIARLGQERASREAEYRETIADLHRRGAESIAHAARLEAELAAQRAGAAKVAGQMNELEAELATRRNDAAKVASRMHELEGELARQQIDAAKVASRTKELEAELVTRLIDAATAARYTQDLEAELTTRRTDAATAASRIREIEAELEAQRKQTQLRAIEVDALRRSTSWRITAWLRWLKSHAVR